MTALPDLRLGILGLSPGNGHPYSWSAIFNGYDPVAMAECPFPVIPAYLARQEFPRDSIQGARVTHVWAQDRGIAIHVAAAAQIPNVVDDFESMIGEVDAVLLARDDAENHVVMSAPFLDAGLPVYIDKPIALRAADLAEIYSHQQFAGQVFSCSALRYAAEFSLDARTLADLGEIHHVHASVPNSWEKYAVHVVDPVLSMMGLYGLECGVKVAKVRDRHVVTADWGDFSATFTTLGRLKGDIRLSVFGTAGSRDLVFRDTFTAFKRTLEEFVSGIRSRREVITRAELASVVHILERGMQP